jgi:hypothetical protein
MADEQRRMTKARKRRQQRVIERVKHWRSKLRDLEREDGAQPAHMRGNGWYQHCVRVVQRRLAKWERELKPEKETAIMRAGVVDDAAPAGMIPPHPGWMLRTKRTLNLNGRVVGPNTVITPADLAAMMNSDALLKGGYIAWCAPQADRPWKPAPTPVVQPPAPMPPTAMQIARRELDEARREMSEEDWASVKNMTVSDVHVRSAVNNPPALDHSPGRSKTMLPLSHDGNSQVMRGPY